MEAKKMAKKKENRVIISLACEKCKRRNYSTTKNRQNTTGRLEIKKYCPHDREHTNHKEVR
jgi:large subunit ribosomal protein L33